MRAQDRRLMSFLLEPAICDCQLSFFGTSDRCSAPSVATIAQIEASRVASEAEVSTSDHRIVRFLLLENFCLASIESQSYCFCAYPAIASGIMAPQDRPCIEKRCVGDLSPEPLIASKVARHAALWLRLSALGVLGSAWMVDFRKSDDDWLLRDYFKELSNAREKTEIVPSRWLPFLGAGEGLLSYVVPGKITQGVALSRQKSIVWRSFAWLIVLVGSGNWRCRA